jgi:hypothetical protein
LQGFQTWLHSQPNQQFWSRVVAVLSVQIQTMRLNIVPMAKKYWFVVLHYDELAEIDKIDKPQ